MTPAAWHNSVQAPGSIFLDTYKATRSQVEKAVKFGNHDVIIEVGCGTGDIIGELNVDYDKIDCYGIDINQDFIDFCKKTHKDRCTFLLGDATELSSWWEATLKVKKYERPLVLCVNNTLGIMPDYLRGRVVAEMISVAGDKGRCLVTAWNGRFFSHAIMNYYMKNEALCGKFSLSHVNWDERTLVTPSNYSTHWLIPQELQKILRSFDVDLTRMSDKQLLGEDHINTDFLGIFAWFSQASTSRAKSYYDSEDAQKFYNSIWGDETTHIGRYDLLTDQDKSSLSKIEQISKAQLLHEMEFIEQIRSKFGRDHAKIRIVDFGCGFGGLLRRLWQAGQVWSATGCDIAGKMCSQARHLNAQIGCEQDITILEESYLDVSVPDESADLVISMDALLHVGPERQIRAIQEASRILRPGGWIIFTDIMQQEQVDAAEMQPIYDRIHLSKLGTVSNYQGALEEAGFDKFEFQNHSSNVSKHYGTIREVLIEKADEIGLSKDYASKMEKGLSTWSSLAPKNILWGFLMAQKNKKTQ